MLMIRFFRDIQGIKNRSPDDNKDVKSAYDEALKALELKKSDRIKKLYACIQSDEEMSDAEDSEENQASDNKDKINGIKETKNENDDDDDPVILNVRFLWFEN